jgi:hypothetical protein
MTTTGQQINTATTGGLSRMDDAEYEETFSLEHADAAAAGTPRPGTSDADIETAIKGKNLAVWSFSQAAKQHAADVKRRRSPKSRTVYRMGANTLVKNAIQHLKKKLDETLEVHQSTPHLSEQDFNILKQGIENFRVKIIMDDSITLEELARMREANRSELTKMQFELQTTYGQYSMCDPIYIQAKNKNADLLGWDNALTAEIIRVRQTKGATPSQHAQISPNDSGVALSNILDPHTIHSKFTSLHNLTKQIRQELIVFLTSDTRVSDRVEVVKQIKEACIAARAARKAKEAAA